MSEIIESLSAPPSAADLAGLHSVLGDSVEGGASVGFMLPLADTVVAAYWADIFADIAAGQRVLLVARNAGHVTGSVQLELAQRPNSLHRCELQKLLVLRSHRGHGLGTALMHAAEAHARLHRRMLIVLDTSATGNALGLFVRCGYTRLGAIPRYARDPDGPLIDTVIHYKELS